MDSQFENELNDFLDNADLYNKEVNIMKSLEDILSTDVVLVAKDMYSVSTQLVNSTDSDIEGVSVNLVLLDTYVSDLLPGTYYVELFVGKY